MVPYVTLRLRLFPHLRWGFANYSIKEFDKAITVQTELSSNVLISISGIGPVLSACIMAEIGDINRFGNHAQLAKHVSLSLVRRDKEYRDFYHLKYKAVNRYQHKCALSLIARKFVRLSL